MATGSQCLVRTLQRINRPCQHFKSHASPRQHLRRPFHASAPALVIKPFILADIGEGIKEVQIIQWFVEPEARVEQFDKLCEVQSDKAATEITSRFDGVIKKLYYEAEDMAQVGKPLCDIDIQSDILPEDEQLVTPPPEQAGTPSEPQQPQKAVEQHRPRETLARPESAEGVVTSKPPSKHAALATPAVRGLLKELDVQISDITGTGKDGRVLKEDVHRFAAQRDAAPSTPPTPLSTHLQPPPADNELDTTTQRETTIPLTPIQTSMFKTMTRSLSIPHFLYADEYNLTALTALRRKLNAHPQHIPNPTPTPPPPKLSVLPFIIKAVSLALNDFPILNARIDLPSPPPSSSSSSSSPSTPTGAPVETPTLALRPTHNIGVAIDTPTGLLVPVLRSVNTKSILAIAAELAHLSALARSGKLTAQHLSGATFTVSNVGSIGGTVVAPVIVGGQVAILGVGKGRVVPGFAAEEEEGVDDGSGEGGGTGTGRGAARVVRREVCHFSWSADHRVVDGATVARCSEVVRRLLEEPARMVVRGR